MCINKLEKVIAVVVFLFLCCLNHPQKANYMNISTDWLRNQMLCKWTSTCSQSLDPENAPWFKKKKALELREHMKKEIIKSIFISDDLN